MESLIEARNVNFGYDNLPILRNATFSVQKGDFVSIIGSNGAGKSTLIRLLLGELTPDSGSVRLFGQEVRHFHDWPKIGYLAQNSAPKSAGFPATAEEVVRSNLFSEIGLFGVTRKRHRQRAVQALEMVGVGGCGKQLISQLSGGQLQRVMLARVLVGRPEVMLLDEPTTGVDADTVQALYQLLSRLNREEGLSIIMVTHDIGRAADVVSRVLCLEEGSLLELDKAQIHKELAHRHKHPHPHNDATA